MRIFNPFKKTDPNSLETALKACQDANKQGYSEALMYLEELSESISQASDIIRECIDGMNEFRINDTSLIKNVQNQLYAVQTEFRNSHFEAKSNLESKRKQSDKFNITLFGRTKVGKSTLMEVLTHGDGSHMGKGGQRTTRDVRQYEWRGMTVTDTPGIEAYDGEEDDEKAAEAAIFADLILFMITAGQPEKNEADWLVKLKKMDKPLICLCNYKQSIDGELRLKRLLDNPQKLEENMNIEGLKEQFNTFIHDQLPTEHVDILITHLLAKFYSQQPEYASKKAELEKASRFSYVEQSIVNEICTNGVLHRKKCYLSIIDAPLYQQMNQLFVFSAQAYSQFRVIQDKATEFDEWCERFNDNEKRRLLGAVVQEFNKIRNSIPGFVEGHLEDDDVSNAWKEHCSLFNTQYNIERRVHLVNDNLERKISDLFSEIRTEIDFSLKLKDSVALGNYQFINWKKGLKWAGAIGTAGLTIAATFFAATPLGWAAVGVYAICGFFAWLCDSREDKLRERRMQLSGTLNKGVDKAERQMMKKLSRWFDDNFVAQEIQISRRLRLVGRSMLSLANGHRELALGYSKNHRNISKKMAVNILHSMNVPKSELDRIYCVARVPGRRTVIVVEGKEDFPINSKEYKSRLGNKEDVRIIKLDSGRPIVNQIRHLLKCFGFDNKPLVKKVNNERHTVVDLYDNGYQQFELDSLDIIQQILNVHINLK